MLAQQIQEEFLPEFMDGLGGKQLVYNKYDFIYPAAISAHKIYFIQEGLIRMGSISATGKELTYCLLQEGALIGNFAVEQSADGRAYAQAFSKVKLRAYSEWEVQAQFQKDMSSGFEMFNMMQSQLRRMEEQFKMLAYYDVKQRIVHFLLYLAEINGYRHQRITFIPHQLTHDDIGKLVHTSRQTVTVTLRELQKEGLLSYDRSEFRLYQYEALKAWTDKLTD